MQCDKATKSRQGDPNPTQAPKRKAAGALGFALWDSRFGIRDRPAPPASRSRRKDLSGTLGQLQLFSDTAVQLAILRRFSIACHLVPNIYLTALSGLGHSSTLFSSSQILIVALSHHRIIASSRNQKLPPPRPPLHPTPPSRQRALQASAAVMASYQQYAQLGKGAAERSAAASKSSCKQPPIVPVIPSPSHITPPSSGS